MTTTTELKKLLFSMILKTPIWLAHLAANVTVYCRSKEESLLVVDPFGRKSNKYSSTHPQQPMF